MPAPLCHCNVVMTRHTRLVAETSATQPVNKPAPGAASRTLHQTTKSIKHKEHRLKNIKRTVQTMCRTAVSTKQNVSQTHE